MLDANEIRALAACALAAGCLLLVPGERVSSATAFVLAAALFAWHLVRLRRGPR